MKNKYNLFMNLLEDEMEFLNDEMYCVGRTTDWVNFTDIEFSSVNDDIYRCSAIRNASHLDVNVKDMGIFDGIKLAYVFHSMNVHRNDLFKYEHN